MIYNEDLEKNLNICVASKNGKTDDLVKWYDAISKANLCEREEYQKKNRTAATEQFVCALSRY